MLNIQKGNMYPFVTHTWNPIRGKCPHECVYCYMNGFPQKELHFANDEIKTDLGKGNYIFVGSSTDMWAETVPAMWIEDTLRLCNEYPENTYLFQSKNPTRFKDQWSFPKNTILATTIETNRDNNISKAPQTYNRYQAMTGITMPKTITIEPIMDFDLDTLVMWISQIKPQFVSIGADSKNHHLPEPSATTVQYLVEELKRFTSVKCKENLRRIMRQELPFKVVK